MGHLLSRTEQEIGGVYVHLTTSELSACYFSFILLFVFYANVCLIRFSVPSSVNVILQYLNITCKNKGKVARFLIEHCIILHTVTPPFLSYTNRIGDLVDLRTGLDTVAKDVCSRRKFNPDSPVVEVVA